MDQKYCTLPGAAPIRIARTDGRCIIIGETPRLVPEDMVRDAIAKGAFSEEQLAGLAARLTGVIPESPQEPVVVLDSDRFDAIKSAVIVLVNEGNPTSFTAQGKPRKEILEASLGFEITGKERDEAFAEVGKV